MLGGKMLGEPKKRKEAAYMGAAPMSALAVHQSSDSVFTDDAICGGITRAALSNCAKITYLKSSVYGDGFHSSIRHGSYCV
jgi:hypothetical protein